MNYFYLFCSTILYITFHNKNDDQEIPNHKSEPSAKTESVVATAIANQNQTSASASSQIFDKHTTA